jgi:ubiquinone/menaquinone biosynthesis C-methylase UbiE
MRVLDLGTGRGDLAFLAMEIVGPVGSGRFSSVH